MVTEAVSTRIGVELADVRASHGVHIPLAVESGSRAWGFPSPDSDYDGRFIFVRPVEQVLSPWPERDVIELPITGELDVNGWELGKALKLLLRGNAVVLEWLQSPIVYAADPRFREELTAFAQRFARRELIARHYLHLGRRQQGVHLGPGDEVALKKVFYALRPAAALRWMRLNPDRKIPPMHFPTLMAECEPPAGVAERTAELIARKAETRELSGGAVPAELLAFIAAELGALEDGEARVERLDDEARRAAKRLLQDTTLRLDREDPL